MRVEEAKNSLVLKIIYIISLLHIEMIVKSLEKNLILQFSRNISADNLMTKGGQARV